MFDCVADTLFPAWFNIILTIYSSFFAFTQLAAVESTTPLADNAAEEPVVAEEAPVVAAAEEVRMAASPWSSEFQRQAFDDTSGPTDS